MLDLGRQYAEIRSEVLAAITAVCDSQQFILGPEAARFEAEASPLCGNAHAVGCSSGTDALWLALAASGIGPGDSVLTTPFSFFATASSILRCGATPLLADIDPATFNLSPAAAEAVLKAHPAVKAILPVHLYGQCADSDAFRDLAARFNVLLIEDAAQAFGASWRGTPAGALGHAAAFSFYPTKNLSAFGDAGMAASLDAAIAERMRALRTHGMTRRYYHDEIGWNARLDGIQAAVLRVKLRHVAAGNQRRRELAARYSTLIEAAGLTAKGILLPFTDPRAEHVFHQYVLRAPQRDALRAHLASQDIETEVYYPVPLHLQQALKSLGYQPGDFPESERAAAEVLALPIYPELREDEQQRVIDAIAAFYA
jgi:dTDP-4-amino-4,6-dideoxygalactose transaminase